MKQRTLNQEAEQSPFHGDAWNAFSHTGTPLGLGPWRAEQRPTRPIMAVLDSSEPPANVRRLNQNEEQRKDFLDFRDEFNAQPSTPEGRRAQSARHLARIIRNTNVLQRMQDEKYQAKREDMIQRTAAGRPVSQNVGELPMTPHDSALLNELLTTEVSTQPPIARRAGEISVGHEVSRYTPRHAQTDPHAA